uniref:Uncharacterized protein LOC105120797 n=1 Tax=Rhizophora mucronata TaxID=61149 RepID=A0A2P2J0H5_RHIMU
MSHLPINQLSTRSKSSFDLSDPVFVHLSFS